MSFFHFEPARGNSKAVFAVADQFWMYWIVAVPLSGLAFAAWVLWEMKCNKTKRA
jgi:hypothetical protein